ncbi:outer membrane lipoprotein-sorting protein [Prosthecobacter fusiformis]|uniref:Outer membrane lipoprotein-sorting protein n=1 Tax=Prosthecobacter fusiformis TaxID=48464 RepID=A0A4R7RWE4_9BACT|nr:outer membrane lipoprotein carrier protein LolA [Prosthecobacter fusiformis]TDU69338.1 outer membrane lipoprotein-sorting protein [Prosthecobacter fusiformis]
MSFSSTFRLLLLLAVSPLAANAQAQKPLPPMLMQWAEAQKDMPDMVVAFRQTRTTPALKAPLTTSGKFWRFKDGAFRWELGQPAATILVRDQSEFRVREGADGAWQPLDEKDARYRMWSRFLSGQEASPEELQQHFLVDAVEQTPDVTAISLRPKAPFIRRHLRQLDLQISPKTFRLLQLRVLQGDGATLTMTFSEPQSVSIAEKAQLLAR